LKVQVNVNNLFNRHYYARVGQFHTFNIPGKERNVFASVRYSF
jgi:outer membrane receptor for ferric coprogen and ferric-rhodotorulic acid